MHNQGSDARVLVAASFAALVAWSSSAGVGCAERAVAPPSASPSAPTPNPGPSTPPEPECKSDADCTKGEQCQESIRAACDTCDGGTVVHVCRPAR